MASALRGPTGATGAASTVPGPTGPQGNTGPQGPTGADSTVPGPQGPAGADSTVPGPQGPQGPAGADSTVPGPQGPQGPAGADSTVPGPTGPAGPQGPTGPTGASGPAGPSTVSADPLQLATLGTDSLILVSSAVVATAAQGSTADSALQNGDSASLASLTLPKASGSGIKIDDAAPVWGWRDLLAEVDIRGTGINDPSFLVYGATTMRVLSFSATTMQECFVVFHLPHDYVPGTAIYLHTHWSNAAATPNTGNVMWSFDYSFAKGHNQQAFTAFTKISVTQASPATRYWHNIAETTAITIAGLEVDGLLMVRCYRDAANAADTCTDAVFLHTVDMHYQSTNMATKNKAPSFYT
jgi:hypothetical protein